MYDIIYVHICADIYIDIYIYYIYIDIHMHVFIYRAISIYVSIVLLLSTTGPRPERSPCPRRGGSSAAPGCEGPKAHTSTGLFENVGRKAEV